MGAYPHIHREKEKAAEAAFLVLAESVVIVRSLDEGFR